MQLLTKALVMSSPKILYLQKTCLIHSWIAASIIPLWEAQVCFRFWLSVGAS